MMRVLPMVYFTCLFGVVLSIGCGEPLPKDRRCSDWQCTRNFSNFCVRGFDQGERCGSDADCYLDLQCSKNASEEVGTCQKAPSTTTNTGVGLIAAVVGVLCFGSSFVPIKRFKMYCGDGAFAQFCMNFGRFLVGFVILLTRTNRWFYWDAALGGALWSVGNALGVPIIQCIGIGLGVSIWGSTNMLLGWASGHFGWWGVKVEIANRPSLEYLGVTFALISIVLFIFVKPKPQVQHQSQAVEESDADSPAQAERADKRSTSCQVANVSDEESMKTGFLPDHGRKGYDTLQPGLTQKLTLASTLGARRARVIGVSLAIVAGTLFGLCMDPAQHMMSYYSSLSEEEDVKYSPFGFDYVFSNNVGALMFSIG